MTDTPFKSYKILPSLAYSLICLAMTTLLGLCAFSAPTIELGFVMSGSLSALLVALAAWRMNGRTGEVGMLALYLLLGGSLVLATAGLVDFSNFTLLGDSNDDITGMLMGGIVAYVTVGVIAVRLSARFPMALTLGLFISILTAWSMHSYVIDNIDDDFIYILNGAGLLTSCFTLLCISRCRRNLSDDRLMAVVLMTFIFLISAAPGSDENHSASLLINILGMLLALQFTMERKNCSRVSRLLSLTLLVICISDFLHLLFHKILSLPELVAGIPFLLISIPVIWYVWLIRSRMPKPLTCVALMMFSGLALDSILPERISGLALNYILALFALFLLTCVFYSLKSSRPDPLRVRFRQAAAMAGIAAIALFSGLFVASGYYMLENNYGVARVLPLLRDTVFWPGDEAFVRLALQEESYWGANAVKPLPENSGQQLNDIIEQIRPDEDRFSYISSIQDEQQDDKGINNDRIGITWQFDGESMVIKSVRERSAAGERGLMRGDRVIQLNGYRVKEVVDKKLWASIKSHGKPGGELTLSVVDRQNRRRELKLASGETIENLPFSKVLNYGGRKVGYLFLNGFNDQQFENIGTEFEKFSKAGISELVVDLRYNNGGYLNRILQLTSYVAGKKLKGELFCTLQPNQRFADRQKDHFFQSYPSSLALERVAVLTTDATCSASEMFISTLAPYIRVITVGEPTCGKPFSMNRLEFGDNILLPITARVLNADGWGDYDGGIAPDIPAKDDLKHQLGDPQEEMLKKALQALR